MKNLSLKTISALVIAATALSSCRELDCVTGSGNQVSSTRNVGNFSKVETSGAIKVVLKQGGSNGLRIIADDNIQEKIQTEVQGNKLVIDMNGNLCDAGPITVYISSREYEGVDVSGAVEIISDGKLNVTDFELDLSGSSKVTLDINAAKIKTSSSGASEIHLKGQASSHELDLSGSSSIEALDLVVGKYRIESSGASNSRINVLNELSISSSGASEVQYRGNPASIKNSESGASSLRKID